MSRWVDQLADELDGVIKNLVHASILDSTHLCSLRLIEQLDTEGVSIGPTVIVADQQGTGTGRGNRSWVSPRGGLYFSWVVAGFEKTRVPDLPMLAAVAAWNAVQAIEPMAALIKWPNDIVIAGEKAAGLICHVRHGDEIFATVGLGVNGEETPSLNEPSLLPPTCLSRHVRGDLPPDWKKRVLTTFLIELGNALEDPSSALELWRKQLLHSPGDELTVRLGSGECRHGTLLEVTQEGHLKLKTKTGELVVTSGDVLES